MVRVIADTNILISGLLFRGGNPNTLLEMARSGAVQLVISDAILDEMADVLGRKFDWPPERVAEARHQIERFSQKVEPSQTLDAVAADPADNKILECAVTGSADYLVSGDKHLLSLESFRGIPIVKVADFLDMHAQRGRDH